MSDMAPLRLGSRGSALARWQAEEVARRLTALGQQCRIEYVTTTGDRRTDVPLAAIGGQGLFTQEIEAGLLAHLFFDGDGHDRGTDALDKIGKAEGRSGFDHARRRRLHRRCREHGTRRPLVLGLLLLRIVLRGRGDERKRAQPDNHHGAGNRGRHQPAAKGFQIFLGFLFHFVSVQATRPWKANSVTPTNRG